MDTNVNYTIVGIFVITLLTAMILGIVWLSSGLSMDEYNYYLVYMEESVSGMSSDSPVEFNGVIVGNIKNMRLNVKNPKVVELTLRIKKSTPVTRGTVATLGMRGLTGISFIALQDNGTNTEALKKPQDEKYPVIKTIPSLRMRLDYALTKLTMNVDQVSKSLRALLSRENLRSIRELLDLSQHTVEVIQNRTLPETNQTLENLNSFSQNLVQIANEIKQNPAVLIRGKESRPLGPGEH